MVGIPGDALVVRGGDPHAPGRLKDMIGQAKRANELKKRKTKLGYSLSVYAGYDPSKSENDLIRDIAAVSPIPNPMIAVTTAAQLLAINCKLIPDRRLPCHVRVVLGTEADPERVDTFLVLQQ